MDHIKIATIEDLRKISHCHCAAFPDSLATALGIQYVESMLGWYLSTENTFLIFIEDKDQCVGYIGGMARTMSGGVGSASSMAQYTFNYAALAFIKRPWLIFHSEVRAKYPFIFKNISNRFIRKKKMKEKPEEIFEPYIGLVVIGVHPAFQGKGYGSLMLQEFERISTQKGLKKMVLSVRSDNAQAINSYLRNGWVISRVEGKSTSMEKLLK